MQLDLNKKFIIMIGRSGCGKGTQSELLKNYLEEKYKEHNKDMVVSHITTGGNFREFIKGDNHTAKTSMDILNSGGLMPEFLAIWNWSNIFINNITENETVILDGAPRKMIEVEALHTAVNFYGYSKPVVIYIDVSEAWARDRLSFRGRDDDKNTEEVDRKMDWFEKDVLPCIDYYKNINTNYSFVHVNGEKDKQEISLDIIKKLESLQN